MKIRPSTRPVKSFSGKSKNRLRVWNRRKNHPPVWARECGCSMAVTRGQRVQIPSPSNALRTGRKGSRVRYHPINSPMRTSRPETLNLSAQTQFLGPQTVSNLAIRVTNTHPNQPSPRTQPPVEWHMSRVGTQPVFLPHWQPSS